MLTKKNLERENKMNKIVLILGIMLFTATLGFAATGDDCTDPITVDFSSDLPYSDLGQTTCGRLDDYMDTGMGYYDGGEDIIYELTVGTAGVYNFTMTTTTSWTGMGIFDTCPPGATTLFLDTNSGSGGCEILLADLAVGTYYLMMDIWPTPDCYEFDLSITQITCPEPTTLTVANISQTTADLGWTETGSASTWNIEVGAPGFTPGTTTYDQAYTGVTTNPYTGGGLTASTSYEFYVQADCVTKETSDWAGPEAFSTNCAAVTTFPFEENFDGTWSGSPAAPTCWSVVNNDADTYTWTQSNTYITPTHSVPYAAQGMGNQDDYLITPALVFADDYRVKWWDKVESASYNNTYDVLISTTTNDIASFTDNLGTYNCVNVPWTEHILNLDAYNGETIYIAFHQTYSAATYYGFGIDDVLVEEIPACPDPTDLTTTNITQTTADLGWTEAGTATTWEYAYGVAPFAEPIGAGTSTTDNPVSIAGLTASTDYEWYVRADCGAKATSDWAGPEAFSTPCAAVTTFPFIENFDAALSTPACWINSSTEPWKFDTDVDYGASEDHTTGLGYFTFVDDSSPYENPSNLDTPLLDVTGLTIPMLTFWYWIGENTTGSTLYIDIFDGTSWTEGVASYTPINEWTEGTINISAYSSAATQIRFRGIENESYFDCDICVDDVSVYEAPSCIPPSDLVTSNIGITSADLGWTENNTPPAPSWDIEWGATPYTFTGTPTVTGVSNPNNLAGLSISTEYTWQVRANCGGGDYSTWAGPETFTTSDGKATNPDPANNAINVEVTAKTFDWDDVIDAFGYTIDIGTATGLSDIVNNANCPTSTYTYSGADWDFIEDYYWTITTYYTAKVTVAGDEWSFTTACDACTLPIVQGFNAATIPACWSETIVVDPDADAALTYVTSGEYPTCSPDEGTHMVKFNSFNCDDGDEIRLESPEFSTAGMSAARVLFAWYESSNYPTYLDEGVTVQWSLDGSTWNDGTFYQRLNATNGWYDKIYNLPAGAIDQSTVYVGFLFHSQYGYNCYFDNVTIQETPSCPAPTSPYTDAITDTGADFNWTAGGTEPNWNVEYGPFGFHQGAGTMVINTSNPYTATRLNSATMYDWYVQADCDGGAKDESIWVGPQTFSTTGAGSCDHYVVLIDEYGDGWNGGVLDIYRNGNLAIPDLTLTSGAGPDTTVIAANQGDSLFFDYTAGSYAYENEYYVYRVCDDLLIISQGAGSVEPIDASVDNCCPPPTLGVTPSPYDFGNVPYNKTPTQVFTLTNIGVGTVTVTNAAAITLSGDLQFTIVSTYFNNGEPGTLPPDAITVEVQFAPGAAISYSTILSVVWAGSVKSQTDVTITGNGCTPVANDDCIDAEPINAPYPQSGSGSNECAYVDCPGFLDWNTVWYEIELPYALNDVYVTICGSTVDLFTVGVVLMDDCACDDYFLYTSIAWGDSCGTGYQGAEIFYNDLAGPTTLLWPAYAADDTDTGIAFNYEVDVKAVDFKPAAPDSVDIVVDNTANTVTVSWTYIPGLTYNVYSDTDPNGTFATVAGTGITAGSLVISPIPTVNTFYRVTADVLVRGVKQTQTYTDPTLHRLIEKAPRIIGTTKTGTSNQRRK